MTFVSHLKLADAIFAIYYYVSVKVPKQDRSIFPVIGEAYAYYSEILVSSCLAKRYVVVMRIMTGCQ